MRIKIRDVRLFFDVDGTALEFGPTGAVERPTLVLLHGGPGFDHSSLRPFFARFSHLAQVIYYDHRGNGRSDRSDPSCWNLSSWADDLKELCDALDIASPIVFGQSFGGMVATRFASRYPDRVAALVLSSTTPALRLDRMHAAFMKRAGEEAATIAVDFWRSPDDRSWEAYRQKCLPLYHLQKTSVDTVVDRSVIHTDVLYHFIGGELQTLELTPELASVVAPTLILAGEDDPIFPPECASEIASGLRNAPTVTRIVSRAAHGVFHDQPQIAYDILTEFLFR